MNDALRIGLGMRGKSSPVARYEVKPHSFGFKPGIDINRLNQLVDELEAEDPGSKESAVIIPRRELAAARPQFGLSPTPGSARLVGKS